MVKADPCRFKETKTQRPEEAHQREHSVEPCRTSGKTLDLTFLATGYCQHVFTRTAEPGDDWVYKIPAAFGYILPFKQSFRVFWPGHLYERALDFALLSLPNALCNRLHNRLTADGESRRLNMPDSLVAWLLRSIQHLGDAGEQVVAAHCRRARGKMFARMLEMLEYLSRHQLTEIVLPYQIIRDSKAILRVAGNAHRYGGPILVQKRAGLFENGERLDLFDWDELIQAQQRLWRHGIGFTGLREILGPQSWALLDGHLRLADTSALTRDYHLARRYLSEDQLDLGQRQAMRKLMEAGSSRHSEDYFRFIRKQINRQRFDELWQGAYRAGAAAQRVLKWAK